MIYIRHCYNIPSHSGYPDDPPETPNHFYYGLPVTPRLLTIVLRMSPRQRQRSCSFHLEYHHGGDNGFVSFIYNVATIATTECKDILIAIIISANIQKYTENKQILIFFFFLFIVVTKKCTRIVSYTNEIISRAREVEKIGKRIYASIGIKGLIQATYV